MLFELNEYSDICITSTWQFNWKNNADGIPEAFSDADHGWDESKGRSTFYAGGEIGILVKAAVLKVNNEDGMKLAENSEYQRRTKHLRLFFIREFILDKSIDIEKISTRLQVPDVLTKPFFKSRLKHFRGHQGMDMFFPWRKVLKWTAC